MTDYDGNQASCKVTVAAPEMTFKEDLISALITNDSTWIDVLSGYGLNYKVEDSSVVTIDSDYSIDDSGCKLRFLKPGTTSVIVTDCAKVSKKISVTVKEANWSLVSSSINRNIRDSSVVLKAKNVDYAIDLTAKSKDESIAKVYYYDDSEFLIEFIKAGTTTITVSDQYGKIQPCKLTITAPALTIKNTNISVPVTNEYGRIDVTSGYDLAYKIADTSIIKAETDSYSDSEFEFRLIKPGKTTVTVTDCTGISQKVQVVVTDAEWSLKKTELKKYYSDEVVKVEINNEKYVDFTAKSSDTKVLKYADDETGYSQVAFDIVGIGTSTITVTDEYGKKQTCKVTVQPDTLRLNKTSVKFDSYNYDESANVYPYWEDRDIVNILSSAKSDNTKVATVKKLKDDDGDIVAEIKPVGAGNTKITLTDQYGQTATVNVTVTQKYIDESQYIEGLEGAFADEIVYGDEQISVWCDTAADIYTEIDGKKYTAKVDSEGCYCINNIPLLPAGKEVKIVLRKGEAKATLKEKVQAKSGKELDISIKKQTYSGKALTPLVTIKDGKVALKKGTDYTVKYSSNKKVGKGTATISFQGNYKGAKSATFIINPKPTKLSKLTAKKKGVSVKWKKQTTQITGYQIQYALNKTFKSGKKTITIKKNTITSKSITKLKAKKTYFVRVRTFKKVGGTNYYSAWSKAKKVKTK